MCIAHQERDGMVYQETPNPADDTYTAFNRDAYRSGDVLPNAGYLRVTVSPSDVRVDYVRAYLAKDETSEQKNGEVAASYTVTPGKSVRTMAHLPDTGQTRHFADGDDSDHPMHPLAYTVNGDGTVTDRVTGLLWQQTDGGEMTWEHARDYCASLNLAGKSGWRLPSNQELFSILDHNNGKPAIDTHTFTRSEAEYWWSSETRAGDPTRIWSVNAGGGTGPHPKRETISAGGEKRYHTRCLIAKAFGSPAIRQRSAARDGLPRLRSPVPPPRMCHRRTDSTHWLHLAAHWEGVVVVASCCDQENTKQAS